MHDSYQGLLDDIRTKKTLDEAGEKMLREALGKFSKAFAP
jgi:hypothetical protein